jgi:hypothetical protein
MQDQPSRFRFSLRALFVSTAFVGLGLYALKCPSPWLPLVLGTVIVFLFCYAVVAVLASTGSRRLFWAAFATMVVTLQFGVKELPMECSMLIWHFLPVPNAYQELTVPWPLLHNIASLLSMLAISTVAAYIIPRLVQRGQEKQ